MGPCCVTAQSTMLLSGCVVFNGLQAAQACASKHMPTSVGAYAPLSAIYFGELLHTTCSGGPMARIASTQKYTRSCLLVATLYNAMLCRVLQSL